MEEEHVVTLRLPSGILGVVDAAVDARLYRNRTEVLRELIRQGIKTTLYRDCGGFCQDLRQIVDCCHDDQCKFKNRCGVFTKE